MLSTFDATQPLATRFFRNALQSNTLAHGYVLRGPALATMYGMALALAKILNCAQRPAVDAACDHCQNCRWITQNAHPAVMTISRLTGLVSDRGGALSEEDLEKLAAKGTQQTQIRAEQLDFLLGQLAFSSEYCRVIVFCDVEELPASLSSPVIAPFEWQNNAENAEKSFHIRPLTTSIFNAASANRLLKTLEEPPPRTVFFFLTDTEESLLETIVSRCQVAPFVREAQEAGTTQFSAHQAFLNQWRQESTKNRDFYAHRETFLQYFVEQAGLTETQALDVCQQVLQTEFKQQAVMPETFQSYVRQQQLLEHTKRMLQAKTNPEQTLNQLFYQWTNC